MESPFKRLDDEKFAELMERWLANGGAQKIHEALNPHVPSGYRAVQGLVVRTRG